MDGASAPATKRKAAADPAAEKRQKTKKQWTVPRKNDRAGVQARAIQPGDSGIWATCNKGREAKCVGELRDLFAEVAAEAYGVSGEVDGEDGGDIEGEIEKELEDLNGSKAHSGSEKAQLFTPIKIDMPCVVFFKTIPPVDPVTFVQRICEAAMADPSRKRTRNTKRLTPMTGMDRASPMGLAKLATNVLTPHFNAGVARKFAIRPSIRNHSILTRNIIIESVAAFVGPGHEVDLSNPDKLTIVVEVYQNICGVSVLDASYERLKRFNLAEIFEPTAHEEREGGGSVVRKGQGMEKGKGRGKEKEKEEEEGEGQAA